MSDIQVPYLALVPQFPSQFAATLTMGRFGRPTTGFASRSAAMVVALAVLVIGPTVGCRSSGVDLRSVPVNPLTQRLNLESFWGPQPSEQTVQVLRVCNLESELDGDPRALLQKLQAAIERDPSPEKLYAFSELAYLGGKKAEKNHPQIAMDLYSASVLYAYHYLFDEHIAYKRNPYDPQFRGACDLYNTALEESLRLACKGGGIVPGQRKTIRTAAGDWDITCVIHGSRWRAEDFDRFEFVSDYEIKGLKNHYRRHGLGVPLIAIRRSYEGEPAAAKYYPTGLSFPVTAFLRPLLNAPAQGGGRQNHQALLELYDPLSTVDTMVAGHRVPLEADLSTPLAYFLSDPTLESLATIGLLSPESLRQLRPDRPDPIMGLHLVQPYEPGKIPVLLVHGLWSSPMTWMEMFNDLRAQPEIRENFQFWFYLYPTGQPFWTSAAQLRRDLAEVRQTLDPLRQEPSLDQMVLIGHSMGGLVSRMQTINSRNDFWSLASAEPFDRIRAEPEVRQELQETFFFRPNPSIGRVITVGTPHAGSTFSNQTTQWLLGRLISLPQQLVATKGKLFRNNPKAFGKSTLLKVKTSIDSLSPKSPIFRTMQHAQRGPWVKYHNIVGSIPNDGWWTAMVVGSDGVVTRESARSEDAISELTVPADHSTIHSHPMAVLEVRRILREHLAGLRSQRRIGGPVTVAAEPPNAMCQ